MENNESQIMAEEKDNLNISLHIYDTDIKVFNIKREDEVLYRQDAKLINDLLNVYHQNFVGKKSSKEIMYFAMIDLGLRLQRELQRNDTKPYDDILSQLTSEIEEELCKG